MECSFAGLMVVGTFGISIGLLIAALIMAMLGR